MQHYATEWFHHTTTATKTPYGNVSHRCIAKCFHLKPKSSPVKSNLTPANRKLDNHNTNLIYSTHFHLRDCFYENLIVQFCTNNHQASTVQLLTSCTCRNPVMKSLSDFWVNLNWRSPWEMLVCWNTTKRRETFTPQEKDAQPVSFTQPILATTTWGGLSLRDIRYMNNMRFHKSIITKTSWPTEDEAETKKTTVVILYFRAVSTCTQSRNSYSGSGETLHGRSCFGHPQQVCGRMRLSVAAAVETVSLALLTQMLRVAARRLRLFLLLVQRSLQHHNDAARKTALSRGPRSDRRRYHVTDCAAAYLWHWHAYPR